MLVDLDFGQKDGCTCFAVLIFAVIPFSDVRAIPSNRRTQLPDYKISLTASSVTSSHGCSCVWVFQTPDLLERQIARELPHAHG